MNSYLVVSLILIFMLLARFINNLYKYHQTVRLYNEYLGYIRTTNIEFLQKKEEIKSLFKDAGISDFGVLHQEFLGFGQFANMTLSGFENMNVKTEDVILNMQSRFNEAMGVFKKRYRDSYNPMFWLDFVVKLPQFLFEYLGVMPDKLIVKIVLIIYWIATILFGLNHFDILKVMTNQ